MRLQNGIRRRAYLNGGHLHVELLLHDQPAISKQHAHLGTVCTTFQGLSISMRDTELFVCAGVGSRIWLSTITVLHQLFLYVGKTKHS